MTATTATSHIAKATEVTVGDYITEIGTPDGPFYPVVKVNAKSLVVDASDDGEPLLVRVPVGANDQIRIARPN
jgi:hypothetical protein